MKNLDELTWEEIQAWVISLSVRNALEMFHGGGAKDPENPDAERGFITDRQMKAMNIVIRRTVWDAIQRMRHSTGLFKPEEYIPFTLRYIDDYMEPPGSAELEAAYKAIEEGRFDPPGFVPDCTRSEPSELSLVAPTAGRGVGSAMSSPMGTGGGVEVTDWRRGVSAVIAQGGPRTRYLIINTGPSFAAPTTPRVYADEIARLRSLAPNPDDYEVILYCRTHDRVKWCVSQNQAKDEVRTGRYCDRC